MSKPLNRRAAANAFARGECGIRTMSALSFEGDVAYSYAEPIAIRIGGILYRTEESFSMTTAHHIGAVSGAWAIAHGHETVIDVPHGRIRVTVREMGHGRNLAYAPFGRRFERANSRSLISGEAVAA